MAPRPHRNTADQQSSQEQIFRFTADLGDSFEEELATTLDPTVAKELRRSWGGVRESIGDQCPASVAR